MAQEHNKIEKQILWKWNGYSVEMEKMEYLWR